MQHLLSRAVWDSEGVRDDLREHATTHLGDSDAVLVVDETGDLKKSTCTIGVRVPTGIVVIGTQNARQQ